MRNLSPLLLLFAAAVAGAQEPTSEHGGSIYGVITSTAGGPLRDAEVEIRWADQAQQASTLTDEDGRFSFDGLQPDLYILLASHQDYVFSVYGPGGPRHRATQLELRAGQRLKVDLSLAPLASISGRVLDGDGQPLEGYKVSAEQFAFVQGVRRTEAKATAVSDDRGVYLMEKIPTGRFYVRARRPVEPQDHAPLAMALKPGEADMRWDDTFYPSAADASAAATVTVSAGQELTDIDIEMRKRPFFTVKGRVLGFDTSMKTSRVYATPSDERVPDRPPGVLPAPDGSFELHGVPSGEATLVFWYDGPGGNDGKARAWTPIEVRDENLENVVLNAIPMEIWAPILIEGERKLDLPEWEIRSMVHFGLTATRGSASVGVSGDGPAGWRLVVPPGRYRFSMHGLSEPRFYLKDVRLAGVSILDDVLDTTEGIPGGPMEIVIGVDAGTLAGSVHDRDGRPVSHCIVTLVPVPRRPGTGRLYLTSDAIISGEYRIEGITPGRYEVFAWEQIEYTAHWNEDFLRPFLTRGKVVVIEEGKTENLDLDIITETEMNEALARAGL